MMARCRLSVLFVFWLAAAQSGFAQVGAGGAGAGGAGGQGNQNGSGIKLDQDGLLSLIVPDESAGTLDRKRRQAIAKKATAGLPNQASKLRMVSLVRLEKQLGQKLSEGSRIPDDLFYLAGLQRIDFVFAVPEQHDLIVAGPADRLIADPLGRMIAVESGRPAMRLDDFVVALRTLQQSGQVGCSIDPEPARLADLQRFIQQGVPETIDVVEQRFRQMDEILGPQNVRIDGVPKDSHAAAVFVEADYRMKRIAIGLEQPKVKGLKSHLAMQGRGGNTMQRWWFVPAYDAIARSGDGLAFEFRGPRAKLLTEEEVADVHGNRSSSKKVNASAQLFARQFSEQFPQIAENSFVFAELQNLIDWTMVAVLMNSEQLPQRLEWDRTLLLDSNRLPHPSFVVPEKVPSQVNFKRAGQMVVGQVCGGIVIHPERAFNSIVSNDRAGAAEQKRIRVIDLIPEDSNQWWWDSQEQ